MSGGHFTGTFSSAERESAPRAEKKILRFAQDDRLAGIQKKHDRRERKRIITI